MAKLHSYFVLCPLIDQKSFLGVSEDKEQEYVIVTLGRNVVNKYRLSDQKQVGGWTSKDHITSAVIYDKDQNTYVAVFNKNTLKVWKNDSDNLDKIKKFKFPVSILRLQPRKDQPPLVVFENGNCASLPYALENRKSYDCKPMIKESENIIDCASYTVNNTGYICYIHRDNKDKYEILYSPVREELGDLEKAKIGRMKITRHEDVTIVGVLVTTEDQPAVYVLWSDSKMTMFDLIRKSWKTVGSVPWISTVSSVSMAWMGTNHLILFGSNVEQDGAIIAAYNIVLGVASCRYPMKMYSEGARIYCIHDRIILEASNHIGMLPYVLETTRNLSSLLGSHDIIEEECSEIANWDTPTTPMFLVSKDIKDILKLGLTERRMCSQVMLPRLEADTVDFRKFMGLMKQFNDVPESVLVQVLNYTLKSLGPLHIGIMEETEFSEWYKCCFATHKDTFALLDYIFEISFSDALMIPYLRESFEFDNALFVLIYVSHVLSDWNRTISADYETKLLDWCILLMDAFYQQFIMTTDDKVTQVLMHTLKLFQTLIGSVNAMDKLLPALNRLCLGQVTKQVETSSYTIELMQI